MQARGVRHIKGLSNTKESHQKMGCGMLWLQVARLRIWHVGCSDTRHSAQHLRRVRRLDSTELVDNKIQRLAEVLSPQPCNIAEHQLIPMSYHVISFNRYVFLWFSVWIHSWLLIFCHRQACSSLLVGMIAAACGYFRANAPIAFFIETCRYARQRLTFNTAYHLYIPDGV